MKYYTIFLLSMFFSMLVFAQNQSTHLKEVEVTPPKFMGIENVIQLETEQNRISNYVAAHFIYPENGNLMYEGTEVVRFNVTASGGLSNFKVINSVAPPVDQEVIRILKSTEGMWYPGYNNGQPIGMEKEVALEVKVGEIEKLALKHDFVHKALACYNKGTSAFFIKGKPEKAIKYFDEGIRYRPYDKSLYFMRGLCRYELGYTEGARQDWMRLKNLGYLDISPKLADYNLKKLKGYEEFTTMFLE